jgi:hypothetical protein
MRHYLLITGLVALATCISLSSARADLLPTVPVGNDLWDYSQGAAITAQTARSGGTDGISMLGGTAGTWEPNNVLFEDGHSQPYAHYVEWQTSTPVTIGGFNLFVSPDTTSSDPSYSRRSIARFRLDAWDGTQYQNIFDGVPVLPYPSTKLVFSVGLTTSVTASKWRARFDQQVWTNPITPVAGGYYGPRIRELDGFAVPEAGTLTLFALCSLGLLRRNRHAQ